MNNLWDIENIIHFYKQGYFLMGQDGELGWYSVKVRTLIPLDERFHVPKSLKRVLNSGKFSVRINGAFKEVVEGCAAREEVWITDDLKDIYLRLNRAGYAYSFETWYGNELAGGILGVVLGGAFIGESMFFNITEGSKVAMVRLVEHLRACQFLLFDAQIVNHNTARFGAYDIPSSQYDRLLRQALTLDCQFNI